MTHMAKGKGKLRTRRERALIRRREELRKWIENLFDKNEEPGYNPYDRQAKMDRATEDIEHLERRLGFVRTKGE